MSLPEQFQARVADWPQPAQLRFAQIRDCVLNAAKGTAADPLEETLKWGEPSWLPQSPRVGSTLRVSWGAARPDHIGLYVNCNSSLASDIRDIYPDTFQIEKGRVLWLPLDGPLPADAVTHAAQMVLTYHLRKR